MRRTEPQGPLAALLTLAAAGLVLVALLAAMLALAAGQAAADLMAAQARRSTRRSATPT